jgi:hypothetical protein
MLDVKTFSGREFRRTVKRRWVHMNLSKSHVSVFCGWRNISKHGRMTMGGHGLPKVSPGPAMPCPCTPVGGPSLKRPYGLFRSGQAWSIFLNQHIQSCPEPNRPCRFLITELPAVVMSIGIHCRVSKGVEDSRRLPALPAGHRRVGHGHPSPYANRKWIVYKHVSSI